MCSNVYILPNQNIIETNQHNLPFLSEGSLGIDQKNTISVRSIQVTGAELDPLPEEDFFDYENGLTGASVDLQDLLP